MTIDEAIAELARIVGKWQFGADNKRDAALQLGIEALKRLQEHRENHIDITYRALPGEGD